MDSIAFSTNQYPKQSSDFFLSFLFFSIMEKLCDLVTGKSPRRQHQQQRGPPTHVLATTLARAQHKVASSFFFTFERRRRRQKKTTVVAIRIRIRRIKRGFDWEVNYPRGGIFQFNRRGRARESEENVQRGE